MNEKIKELALDAGIGFVLWDDSGRPMIDNYTPEERLAKFAELIIHSCIDAVISVPLPNEYEQRCAESVREYFGIKV